MNTRVKQGWASPEEIVKYDPKKEVNLEVTVTKQGFLIYLNGEFFHFFKARLPWDTFTSIELFDSQGNNVKSLW
jgi:hypothetical protein